MPLTRLLALPRQASGPQRGMSWALMLLVLAACTTTLEPVNSPVPPHRADPTGAADWPAEMAGLRQQALRQAQQPLSVDASESQVRIHVFRAGRAARLGHNHVLSVPKLQGLVLLPTDLSSGNPEGAAFELSFRLDELELDAPAQRAALGSAWASALSAEAIAATRANMLGAAGLRADAHPEVRLRSLTFRGAAPKLALWVEIELHGQRQRQWLPLHAQVQGDRLQARGALLLRQSDFVLQPFSVAAGLLAVQDEVLIEFDLLARR